MVKKVKKRVAATPAEPAAKPVVTGALACLASDKTEVVAASNGEAVRGRKKRRLQSGAATGPSPAAAGSDKAASVLPPKKKRRLRADGEADGANRTAPAAAPVAVTVAGDGGEAAAPTEKRLVGGGRARKARVKAARLAAEAAETPEPKKDEKTGETAPGAATAARVDCTVFVDGVSYDWDIAKIEEFFKECGSIVEVKAPTWQDSGRLRGFAHVAFANKAGRKKALALNGAEAGKKGRYLKIEAAKEVEKAATIDPADVEGKRRLFVKNLPYDATEAEVAGLFKKCGPVVEVRIPTNHARAKGFAYVEFLKSKGLKAAVELEPPPALRGRTLRLDVDGGSGPKAGFHRRPEAYGSGFGPDNAKGKGKGKGGGRGPGTASKMQLF